MKSSLWPKSFHYVAHARLFLLALCLAVTLLVSSIYFFLYTRTATYMEDRLHEQALTVVNLVNHFRDWNVKNDGVYVVKKPGVMTNHYLLEFGLKPDLETREGRSLTLRNHAIMTAEVSKLSNHDRSSSFHMVSRRPIDDDNHPDSLEADAITSFEKGGKEFSQLDINSKPPVYRFLSPLIAEESCLKCHNKLGFQVGKVLGAVSVTISIEKMLTEMRSTRTMIILGALATIGLFVVIVYLLTWRLVSKLDEAQKHLKKQATTDGLTGLWNRRTIMLRLEEEFLRAVRQNEPLCIMIADIDYFKRINDSHGHPTGDRVLLQVANCIRESVRRYDLVGRIGGEEFLIVSPGVDLEEAKGLAERLRAIAEEQVVKDDGLSLSVTISIGLTSLANTDEQIESLLKRADRALYKAKAQGRNRVELL